MTEIENKNNTNTVLNLHLNDDSKSDEFGQIENFNIKLRAICKSSSYDVDSIINNLHECDETLNKKLLDEYYLTDNCMLQPQLTELNSNSNNNNQNSSIITTSNRYINCSEWHEGITSWQHTHPYPYFVNHISLLNRKRNRRFDIEFDESLGIFIPSTVSTSAENNENTQKSSNTTTITEQPNYMKEMSRNVKIHNRVFSNIVYDKNFVIPTIKRASSASQSSTKQQQQQQQQKQPNNSLDLFNDSNVVKPQLPPSTQVQQQSQNVSSIVQPHIYTAQPSITNNLTKQQQILLYNTLSTTQLYKINNDDDQPQKQQQTDTQYKREKTSLSDFENINNNKNYSNNSQQDKIDKIRKSFNAVVNKNINNPNGRRFEIANTRINAEDFALVEEDKNYSNDPNVDQQQQQFQSRSTNFLRSDSETQNYGRNINYRAPINQIEAQINSKTSNALYNLNSNANLALDGEAINVNGEKNSDYYSMARRKDEYIVVNNEAKVRNRLQSINNKPRFITNNNNNNTNNGNNDLSIYSNSNQLNDTPLLPPIISGKRINLPHGPHRQLFLRYMDGLNVTSQNVSSVVKPTLANTCLKTNNKKFN